MESVKCSLCLHKCSPGIKLPGNVLNSKRIYFAEGEKDIPIRNQLQIILLLRKILELPQEKCCDFLRDYDDPCSWINCCNSCSTLVGECRIIFDQIMKLQRQFEHLQTEIKNIIIRSANSEEVKDEFRWGRGVQGEMRSFITKGFYQAHPIKEEFVGELPCHNISISNVIVAESILGSFPEEIGHSDLQQNPLIGVEDGCSTYQMNSLSYETNNCDSEEQGPLRELNEGDDSDNQQDIQNDEVMSKGGYVQSKSIPFFSHLSEYLPENAMPTSSNASIYAEDETFRCSICGEGFSELGSLHGHFCIPTETKPYIDEGFSGTSSHSEENCYICIQGFDDPKDLNDHINSTQSTNNPMVKQYNCVVCGRCFSNYNSLQKHGEIHSGKQTINALQNREVSHTGEKQLKCRFCEESFLQSIHLKHHERIHTGDKKIPIKCQFCERTFTRPDCLKDHERKHTGEKPFKCQVCEKSFFRSFSLTKHERNHHKDKPYSCNFCLKNYATISDLKTHERIHTEDKPYKCSFCEKRFSHSQSLKIHERMHTGERPFACKFCDKSFTRSDNLKIHERSHTGEKPWECNLCTKSFSLSSSFRKHKRNCTGEKPFEGNFVEKGFLGQIP